MEELPLTHEIKPCNETKQKELTDKWLQLSVNDHTEKKNGLTYLSWAWAWQKVLESNPDATYKIRQFEDARGVLHCYQYDENLGYMVFIYIAL